MCVRLSIDEERAWKRMADGAQMQRSSWPTAQETLELFSSVATALRIVQNRANAYCRVL